MWSLLTPLLFWFPVAGRWSVQNLPFKTWINGLETLSMQDSVFVASFPFILLVANKLMQGTCTVCLTCKQLRLPGPFHIQCLRSTACVRSTWGATLRGVDRISNEQRSEAIVWWGKHDLNLCVPASLFKHMSAKQCWSPLFLWKCEGNTRQIRPWRCLLSMRGSIQSI